MPKGSNGEEWSADVVANAVRVMWIVTGEEAETPPTSRRHRRGQVGAKARTKTLTSGQRAAIARTAAAARLEKV
jgi:hypothetical protein